MIQVHATSPHLPLASGGSTEVPLPEDLRSLINIKLACKELAEPPAVPSGSRSSPSSSTPWCSAAYRDDVRNFLDKTVRKIVWGVNVSSQHALLDASEFTNKRLHNQYERLSVGSEV